MKIYQRHEWGARNPDGFTYAPVPAPEVWLHHSVTAAPAANVAAEKRAMRDLESIGQSRFGGGISYTFLVMPSGRVYEGHSVNRQGAHTGGRNDRARAICLVGNYETQAMTEAQINAVAELLRHGKAKGWWQHARLNGGHRDLKATACPGAKAYAKIAEINRRAASGKTGGGSAAPAAPKRRKSKEDRMTRLAEGYHIEYFALDKDEKTLVIGCPTGEMDVTILWHGPGYPKEKDAKTGIPKYDWVAKDYENTVHRMRPAYVEVPDKATGFDLIWNFKPEKRPYQTQTAKIEIR